MTIKEFIEKAVEGGWMKESRLRAIAPYDGGRANDQVAFFDMDDDGTPETWHRDIATILLDQLAWKAVGKVEGWHHGRTYKQSVPARKGPRGQTYPAVIRMQRTAPRPKQWLKNWHRMIDALAEEKTIEEFIATL